MLKCCKLMYEHFSTWENMFMCVGEFVHVCVGVGGGIMAFEGEERVHTKWKVGVVGGR